MNRRRLTIIKYIFDIVLIIILSCIFYLLQPISTPKVLYIPGGSINKIISQLQSENYDVSKLDSFFLRLIGSPQSGWIDMGTQKNTKADFLYKLTKAKAALQNVTLIPGETTYIFLQQVAAQLGLKHELLLSEFEKNAPIAEGIFVPNTYKIPLGITEKEFVALLLKVSMTQHKELSTRLFGTYNQVKWFRYVAIASVIQKESANVEEMSLVSSVIANRVKRSMHLQMDGTLNYGKYSHIKITPKRIKEDKSIYNTYKFKGLPVIPVCNVSFDAIKAALYPAKSDYLYFMKNKNGTHDFSCNYSTHLNNIKHATKRNNK
ncbi:MAG: endolytic transglycosylase MltG [Campylobacterales bacterium]|nr:endolytic transglycosylase MltG [Campylobacterales bacterium]